jgi:hypothetical protein
MQRYVWSDLNKLQVGKYTEYFVKMELTMHGFEVYTTEVDDRGIDFVARHEGGPFIEVQVKSIRDSGYIYMEKTKFALRDSLFLAFVLLLDGAPPNLFLIPSRVWDNPIGVFVSHDYEGRQSSPEWGLNVSRKNMPALEPYRFESTVAKLCAHAASR